MMGTMNPFEHPPTSFPESTEPPIALTSSAASGRRGRMALVALASAGLLGGGIVAVSQFASADEPVLTTATPTTIDDEEPTGEPSEQPGDGSGGASGEVVIDLGNGDEPIVLNLGELGQSFDDLAACLDFPMFGEFSADGELPDMPMVDGEAGGELDGDLQQMIDEILGGLDLENLELENLDLGDLGTLHESLDLENPDGSLADDFGDFSLDGSHITVMGPDGLSVIELGDGDGSVTITKTDGELTISTDGDATVQDLPDFSQMMPMFDDDMSELDLGDLDLDEMFGEFDMSKIESCIADLG